ncbi:unnamed protein product, partial [Discosporangium mesarthrocarpum]
RNCTACGEAGHGPSRCPKQKVIPKGYTVTAMGTKPSGKFTVLAATETRVDGFVEWIADSGATWHMTNEITGMYDFVSNTEDTFAEAANGSKCAVNGKGTLKVVFQKKSGTDIDTILHNVMYIPRLKHNLFSLLAAAERGHTYVGTTHGIEVEGGLSFVRGPGKGYASALAYPTQEIAAAALTPGHFLTKAVDINLFHCSYGHAHEHALRLTARRMGVKLVGKLETCSGCGMGKSIRLAISSHTTDTGVSKLSRLFMDLSGKKAVSSLGGNWYNAIIRDDFSRFMWVYPLKAKSDAYGALELFLAETNVDKAHHLVLTVRSDDGGEFLGGHFGDLCKHLGIRQEHTTADHPQLNGVVERGLGFVEAAQLSARLQAHDLYSHVVTLPPHERLWAEASLWAADAINRTATTANPGKQSPFEMFY